MSMPIWIYVPVVMMLVGLHGFTLRTSMRRIDELQAALLAKRALLGEPSRLIGGLVNMAAGDTYQIKDKNGMPVFEIDAHNACSLQIRSFV